MMQVAFHKGGGRWELYGKVIRWWTKSEYQHVELIFSDGMSYSSRKDGVFFQRIDYTKHPERWDILPMPHTAEKERQIRNHAKLHCGEKYDWLAIYIGQGAGTKIHDAGKWFCSEIVAHVLGIEPELIPPGMLYKIVLDILEAGNA